MGVAIEPAVKKAAKADSAEVRFRANRLLKKLRVNPDEVPHPWVRAARVVRVVERAGNADAKELLKRMSDGDFGAEYQVFGKAAVGRGK